MTIQIINWLVTADYGTPLASHQVMGVNFKRKVTLYVTSLKYVSYSNLLTR